jgi:hypothetical protein
MSKSVFVYAPGSGEPFECSPANARDLTSHAGWSYSPPAPEAPAPETTPPPPPPPAKEETPPPPPPPAEKSEPAPAKTEEKPAAKAEVTIEEVAAPAKASKKADAAE